MSSRDLKIERGRYNKSNEIDDEIHLLLHCNALNNEREILLNSVAANINMQPTNDMFLRIMTFRDLDIWTYQW